MSLYTEFKAFIKRGNVVDLAVGVIVGGAFTKIVNSLVADVLMPPIGYLVGGTRITDIKITLPEISIPGPLGMEKLAPATLNVGSFLQATLDFLIISACIFAIVKMMNAMKRAEVAAPPDPTPTEKLLAEIRDLLKNNPQR